MQGRWTFTGKVALGGYQDRSGYDKIVKTATMKTLAIFKSPVVKLAILSSQEYSCCLKHSRRGISYHDTIHQSSKIV